MKRRRVGGRKDKRVFANTAMRTRKINVSPSVYRGGICL